MNVLVLNAGSSSIKYRLFDMNNNELLLSGMVEHIHELEPTLHRWQTVDGEQQLSLVQDNHKAIFEYLFQTLGGDFPIHVIAHRVVHGGINFTQPTLINARVLAQLHKAVALAPLHNPACIAGIDIALRYQPELPQVAVFDTAFHQTMPEHAYRYAVAESLYRDFDVRRFGFHGISHAYLAQQAAESLERPLDELNLITLHLGNGASVTAIESGRCIDTSMGMTPLEGLIMGSRCGDLDPGAIFALIEQGKTAVELSNELNHDSGLKGLCGSNDMREIHYRADCGDEPARLALQMFCYRIRKYIGAYFAVLGRIDALVFSGGIGEHNPLVRQMICENLGGLGLQLSSSNNQQAIDKTSRIDAHDSNAAIMVIPANEELEIARQAYSLLSKH